MPTDTKLFKAEMSKIVQSGEFLASSLSRTADPLMKAAIPLEKIF